MSWLCMMRDVDRIDVPRFGKLHADGADECKNSEYEVVER